MTQDFFDKVLIAEVTVVSPSVLISVLKHVIITPFRSP